MITLTAEIKFKIDENNSFKVGETPLGYGMFGNEGYFSKIIDKRRILSCDSEIKNTGDFEKPFWGMVSSGGSISFNDYDKMFFDYAEIGLLKSGQLIEVFIENEKKSRQLVGTYFTTKWEYDINSRSVSVSFSDGLEKLQNVELEEYNLIDEKKATLGYIFNHIKESVVENGFNTSVDLPHIPMNCDIEYPKISRGSIWSQMTKVLETGGFVGYVEKDGVLKFEMAN